MERYRKKVDILDKSIMDLLEERMDLSREIGKYKQLNQLNIENLKREEQILNLANKYKNSSEIKDIYKQIFISSKNVQDYKYFLVGKSLEHSISPRIYKMFGISDYNLFPTDNFNEVKDINFSGINITNPYKKEAYKLCDELDESSIYTNVVNTIIRKDNKLSGYNTDYYGFSKLLDYYNISLKGKKVIIIGNGATATTISKVLYKKDVLNIIHLVRTVKGVNEYLLDEYAKFTDFDIIINATPYGTYPNNQTTPLFSLNNFTKLEVIIDVVYNPLKSPLLLEKRTNVKKINGLYMLVAQAAIAASLYTNVDKLTLIEEVYKKINFELTNIILIGMPFSGKSKLGKILSEKSSHNLIDLDLIMQENNQDLSTILKTGTLNDFRELEEKHAVFYSKKTRTIIATGGGIVLSKNAMNALKQNGVIIFLDIPLEDLIKRIDESRPLVKNKEDLINLYNERISLYKTYSDIIIKNYNNVEEIMEKIYEHINS